MRAAIIALMLTFALQAGAGCGELCDGNWWQSSTTADLQAELAAGADVMARDDLFDTPLHRAAGQPSAAGTPANIQA